jgi:MFS transporter, SHS family, lactate transporter
MNEINRSELAGSSPGTGAMGALSGWSPAEKRAVTASFLGWTLDAFDFFLLVFVLKDVAKEFGVERPVVATALTLTLACRPIGALIFGRLADKFGRRPLLMVDVALYSVLGFATAFAPNLVVFLIIRSLFGVAMGGEWGLGASLTMESVKSEARGVVSGLLQSGYPTGYLLASLAYAALYDHIGWRGMFMLSLVPALLVLFIRRHVPESPTWLAHQMPAGSETKYNPESIWVLLSEHWRIVIYGIFLMTAFNFFSHGTQDIYPTFLQVQHQLDARATGTIAIIYNIGAIVGGWAFGFWSQSLGRRRAIIVACVLSLPVAYLWAYSTTLVGLASGAFLMQVCVQGAWGVVPAHLNELSPPNARGTFPGTIYQLGNLIASSNAILQTSIAAAHGENYSFALISIAVAAAVAIALLALVGREASNVTLR